MCRQIIKPSELKSLLQKDGVEIYKWKGFLRGGCYPLFVLESTVDGKDVIGKIVPNPTEGELKHWPKLRHSNINRLLDTIGLDHGVKIFIAPFVGKCIGNVVRDESFIQHPLCFLRKKRYTKGILLGLDFLHHQSYFLLNLSDSTVRVCSTSDEAVICDFSCTVQTKCIPVRSVPAIILFKPPEVRNAKDPTVDCMSIDIWACGILLLQIFTQYLLPWDGKVVEAVKSLDCQVLEKANYGLCLQDEDLRDLKDFLLDFFHEDPKGRCTAEQAYKASFLRTDPSRFNTPARNFWKAYEEPSQRGQVVREIILEDCKESLDFDSHDIKDSHSGFYHDRVLDSYQCYRQEVETDFKTHTEPERKYCTGCHLRVSLTTLQHDESDSSLQRVKLKDTCSVHSLRQMADELDDNGSLSQYLSCTLLDEAPDVKPEWASSVGNISAESLPSYHSQISGRVKSDVSENGSPRKNFFSDRALLENEDFPVSSESYELCSIPIHESCSCFSGCRGLSASEANSCVESRALMRDSSSLLPESKTSLSVASSILCSSEYAFSQNQINHQCPHCPLLERRTRCEDIHDLRKSRSRRRETDQLKYRKNQTVDRSESCSTCSSVMRSIDHDDGQSSVTAEDSSSVFLIHRTTNQEWKKGLSEMYLPRFKRRTHSSQKLGKNPVADRGTGYRNEDPVRGDLSPSQGRPSSGMRTVGVVNDSISNKLTTNEDVINNFRGKSRKSPSDGVFSVGESKSLTSGWTGKECEMDRRWYHRFLCLPCKRGGCKKH